MAAMNFMRVAVTMVVIVVARVVIVGVIRVRILPKVKQTLDDARENIARARAVGGGVRRPVWLNLSEAEPLDPEVRHFYKGDLIGEAFCALAIQVDGSPLGFMVGNLYLRITRQIIPTRLFTLAEDPLPWLREQLP